MVSSTWLYWRLTSQGTLKCVLFMLFIAIFAPTLIGIFVMILYCSFKSINFSSKVSIFLHSFLGNKSLVNDYYLAIYLVVYVRSSKSWMANNLNFPKQLKLTIYNQPTTKLCLLVTSLKTQTNFIFEVSSIWWHIARAICRLHDKRISPQTHCRFIFSAKEF